MKCNKAPDGKHRYVRGVPTRDFYCAECEQPLVALIMDEVEALITRVDELEAKITELQSQQNECP